MGAVALCRLRLPLAALLLAAGAASAHSIDPAAAAPSSWVLRWSFEPWVVVPLALSFGLYAIGLRRLWGHAGTGRGVSRRSAGAFLGGWFALLVALVSPLDALGGQLFSAHMLQHELLMVVAAPLMVLGRPLAVWTWALPPAWRRGTGACFRHPAWRRPWRWLTAPLSAWLIHAAVLWLWHAPRWFDAALASNALHAWQHAAFLFSALLFWWAVLRPAGRAQQGAAMLYLFTTMLHSGALGALLTLAGSPWYATYLQTAPPLGIDPLEDQQLGGLVMWVPAGFAYLASGLVVAAQWLGRPAAAKAYPP